MAASSKIKKVHTISQKQKVFHASNPMLSVLMWGVNHTMTELETVPPQPLICQADFKAFSKTSINNQSYNDQVLPSKFKVKQYCPLVFRDLRERFGEDPEGYLESLCDAPPLEEQQPAGRSHASFFHTHDQRLLIKTLGREEVALFHQTFPAYHAYIVERRGVTLLPHYLGLYRITVNDKETYCIIMRNVFSAQLPMHKVYDLKGSTFDRQANESERAKEHPVFKDNDFTEAKEHIFLAPDVMPSFMAGLKLDVEFLCRLKLMDYSLLVGIHDYSDTMKEEPPELEATKNYYAVFPPDVTYSRVYFIGIIDVLTRYGAKKMAAHTAKGMRHGREAQISTVNPEQYSKRFQEFIASIMSTADSAAAAQSADN